MMTGAGGNGRILLEDLADALKWAGRRVCHRVGDGIVGSAPTTFGPHEIIFPIAADHIRTFHIAIRRDLLERGAVGEGDEAFKIGPEFSDIAMPPASRAYNIARPYRGKPPGRWVGRRCEI